MALRIEDYALIGDLHTAALVGRDGSIDWLCLPRFDCGACFAALLGTPEHGRWVISPVGDFRVRRRYQPDTLILETEFETPEGSARVIDFMPPRTEHPAVVRIVECTCGRIRMRTQLLMRPDYGSIIPWVQRIEGGLVAIAGPDALVLRAGVALHGEDFTTVSEFTIAEGDRVPFVFSWHPSHEPLPRPLDAEKELAHTARFWQGWAQRCDPDGPYRDAIVRSLITLKALTFAPTGGIVAAPTTSLPEQPGGVRNWDYRYCWIRDATFTLYALLSSGYRDEAAAWRRWLVRAIAGTPSRLQIMYGLAGERRLLEMELPWLPGYEGSKPVRIGNAASEQRQLDVYGELLDTTYQCRRAGLELDEVGWRVERTLLHYLESIWKEPDWGIWEVRGPAQQFTHSKVMAWVAFDRAVKSIERFGLEGPVDRFRATRDAIHEEVCRRGFDPQLGSFIRSYDSRELDASLLMIPLVGFLPPNDPRIIGTVEAVERNLLRDGLVERYISTGQADGLPPGEGAFLACTFWLADSLSLIGRREDAVKLFEQLLALRNDVGLLAEEYDPRLRRQLGNFPQAFSHVGLINTARNLTRPAGPAEHRRCS